MIVSIEGVDGSGKSTQAARVADRLRALGLDVRAVTYRSTPFGRRLLALARERRPATLPTDVVDLHLFAALWHHTIGAAVPPAGRDLAGPLVIIDRYFDTTLAVHRAAGFAGDVLRAVREEVFDRVRPALTVLLDLDVGAGDARRAARGGEAAWIDRLSPAERERLRQAFLALAGEEPERFLVLDAARPAPEITERIVEAILRRRAATTEAAR